MTVDARIGAFMQVAGSTTAAIVFLTTYRTGELRALLSDNASTLGSFLREAVICTLLPLLTLVLIVFAADLAHDTWDALTGKQGFKAPQGAFLLFVGLLVMLVLYQVALAAMAWKQWNKKRVDA